MSGNVQPSRPPGEGGLLYQSFKPNKMVCFFSAWGAEIILLKKFGKIVKANVVIVIGWPSRGGLAQRFLIFFLFHATSKEIVLRGPLWQLQSCIRLWTNLISFYHIEPYSHIGPRSPLPYSTVWNIIKNLESVARPATHSRSRTKLKDDIWLLLCLHILTMVERIT